ncbi:MAG: permease-like cell division protein FtsX [candidate division WOR-3 bacterium]
MFALREALIGLKRNGGTTFIAIGIMFFSLFLLGIFLWGTFNLFGVIRLAREKVEINAFLIEELSEKQIEELAQKLKSIVGVEGVEFISKEEALKKFQEEIKDAPSLLEAIKTNPLPSSFNIKLKDGFTSPDKVKEIAEKISVFSEFVSVEYGEKWIDRLDKVVKILFLFDILLGIVIGIASIFIVSNTIRLTVLAQRRTIEVMKLVGATERTIQLPFMVAGSIEGFTAGALSGGLLYLIYQITYKFFVKFYFPYNPIIIGTIVLGIILGMIGSKLAVKSTSKELKFEAPNV